MMNPVEIIRKKRGGQDLTKDELQFIVDGYLNGEIPDYQISSLLMAVYFQGMDTRETSELTNIMLHSGDTVDLSHIPGVKVDKHSTGGVGDKISLPLAPIVAACGVPVPMISGRGLGHTGGTLDKLESIPGFRTNLTIPEYKAIIKEIGIVMIGQTKEIAPADKKLYALRDVTATVESIPLVAGSIMSKKLAEGIDALVLDVKTGRGAFMQSFEHAARLAKTLVEIGENFGKPTIGFITDMNDPLGYAIGNWNEVVESVDCLKGLPIPDIMELTYTLGGTMVMLGKRASTIREGYELCRESVANGKAYQKFLEMVRKQGGDTSYIEDYSRYPHSKHRVDVPSEKSGFIESIDSLELGFSAITLGAGRMKLDDHIDPKAGITLKKKSSDRVSKGDVLAVFYTDKEHIIPVVSKRIFDSFCIADSPPVKKKLIHSIVDKNGVREFQL